MQKPTSKLNFEIIKFVMEQHKIKQLLNERDSNQDKIGLQLNCKYFKKHPTDRTRSSYSVDFIYKTKNDLHEENDDISVFVEVKKSITTEFKVLDIRKY